MPNDMDEQRQKLIDKAKELNTHDFAPMELRVRIREVCAHYVIEAKVDVDRLLRHPDWTVRQTALDIVSWEIGATDGIDMAIDLLFHDPEEEVRAMAALALYQSAQGTGKLQQVVAAFKAIAGNENNDRVRESVQSYLTKLQTYSEPLR
jgi:hypothetical protein